MPRLRFVAKVIISFVLMVVLFEIFGRQPTLPPQPADKTTLSQPPTKVLTEEVNEATEEQMLEFARRGKWIWKDFETYVLWSRRCLVRFSDIPDRHDGLIRGSTDLQVCASGLAECRNSAPQLVRYDGYKALQEPDSQIIPCLSPRGIFLNESNEDAIWAYLGKAEGTCSYK